jgi:hypothetical protein
MRTSSFVLAALVLTAEATPSVSEDTTPKPKTISEDALRLASAEAYFALLRRAQANGWRYSLMAIKKGQTRHFEELKLQLLDRGYMIMSGQPGRSHGSLASSQTTTAVAECTLQRQTQTLSDRN